MNSNQIVYISGLIKKSLLGEMNPEERRVLDQWLEESPRHRELFEKYREPDFLLSVDKREDLRESEIAYSLFMKKLDLKPRQARFILKRYMAVASLIAFVCMASFLIYWYTGRDSEVLKTDHSSVATIHSQNTEEKTADALLLTADGESIPMSNSQETITVSSGSIKMGSQLLVTEKETKVAQQKVVYNTLKILRGKRFKLQLCDGTMVWLNAESEITFPNYFEGANRMVSVKGELLFDVTENKSQPFIVNTQQGNIRVLGTVFNVHCYENEMPATTLVRGKIEYSLGDRSVVLLPGQQCRVSGSNLTVVDVDTYEYTSWIDEIISFKNKKLEEIMNTLSRLYDVTVSYETPSLKNLPFTGAFKQYEHLEDIVQMIEECGLIRIEQRERELIIKKK